MYGTVAQLLICKASAGGLEQVSALPQFVMLPGLEGIKVFNLS